MKCRCWQIRLNTLRSLIRSRASCWLSVQKKCKFTFTRPLAILSMTSDSLDMFSTRFCIFHKLILFCFSFLFVEWLYYLSRRYYSYSCLDILEELEYFRLWMSFSAGCRQIKFYPAICKFQEVVVLHSAQFEMFWIWIRLIVVFCYSLAVLANPKASVTRLV